MRLPQSLLHLALLSCSAAIAAAAPVPRALTPIGIYSPYNLNLVSNDPAYNTAAARADLANIMASAGDTGNLSPAQITETIAALFDVANRYFPELSTKAVVRALMADIRAESDFQTYMVSPGREGSGDSLGLMQVSQGGSKELTLFKEHARITTSRAGPLLDYRTGQALNAAALTTNDLFRPWVNIHVAAWIQANLGKTGSLDPYDWPRAASQPGLSGGVARSLRTSFGSWVAGPHPDGYSAYLNAGDDISAPYLRAIARGVDQLYSGGRGSIKTTWFNSLVLNQGVVDYK